MNTLNRLVVYSLFCWLALGLVWGCGDDDDDNDETANDDDNDSGFVLTSSAFADDGEIPAAYSCDNANHPQGISPQLAWDGAPAGTVYFALTVTDSDANDTAHWGLFDIPADVTALPEAMRPDGELPGESWETISYQGAAGYAGPCPPEGANPHHYVFTLYALDDAMPDFEQAPELDEMQALIQERLLDSTTLTGLFGH